MIETPDRRKAARITIPWHLEGWVHESREVRILNVSTSGAQIEHVEPLRTGASCSLDLPPPLGSIHLTARVVWNLVTGGEQTLEGERRLHYRSGLAFIGITSEQQTVLAAALEILRPADDMPEREPS